MNERSEPQSERKGVGGSARRIVRSFRRTFDTGQGSAFPTSRKLDDWVVSAPPVPLAEPAPDNPEPSSDPQPEEPVNGAPKKAYPFGEVRLSMYDPEHTQQFVSLVQRLVGPKNLDRLATLSNRSILAQREQEKQDSELGTDDLEIDTLLTYRYERNAAIDAEREAVKEAINLRVFGKVQEALGLPTIEDAAEAFQTHRKIANQSVMGHADRLYPNHVSAQLRDEVQLRQFPADLLEMALQSSQYSDPAEADDGLAFEVQRQFLETIISMQSESTMKFSVHEKMKQFNNFLDERVYSDIKGTVTNLEIFAEFDNVTNEMIGDPFYEAPTEEPWTDTHYKSISVPIRSTHFGPSVLTLTDEKDPGAANRKIVRDAQRKGEDVVDPSVVEDNYRMKIVVLSDRATTEQLAGDIFDMATDPDNFDFFASRDYAGRLIIGPSLGIPTGGGDVQINAKAGKGKKPVNYIKFKQEYSGVPKPLKVTFQSIHDYLRETYEVGQFDDATQEHTGPAWSLFAIEREIPKPEGTGQIKDIYYPHELYPALPIPYETNIQEPYGPVADKVKALRAADVFVPGRDHE